MWAKVSQGPLAPPQGDDDPIAIALPLLGSLAAEARELSHDVTGNIGRL